MWLKIVVLRTPFTCGTALPSTTDHVCDALELRPFPVLPLQLFDELQTLLQSYFSKTCDRLPKQRL